ncbi:MAG: T9SS type A sorting domain-containing protein [Chitinophagales bacterium]|nr:T9SS type A sorting domain-containing protein [Chitinophagales bacterium]
MKQFSSILTGVVISLLLTASALRAQKVTHTTFVLNAPTIVNFGELAQKESLDPPTTQVNKEEDEERQRGIPLTHPVPADATVTNITLPQILTRTQSPAPATSFNGLDDNNTTIPPDIACAAGLNNVMLTTNQQYRNHSKNGTVTNTLTINGFWTSTGGQSGSYFDPRIAYDPYNNRWMMATGGNVSGGHSGLFIAVSQTSDPNGLWYQYAIDAQGSTGNWLDFPTLGFNKDWIVMTGNMFSSSGFFQNTKIFVLNKSTLYSGSIGTVNSYTDGGGIFSLQPAITYDNTVGTEYMVASWAQNSGGNGYVRTATITGSVNSPVYTLGNTIGINQPWSSPKDAPQSGTSNKIYMGDDRISSSSVYRNGYLYCSQHVGQPSINATRTSVQWWKINPSNSTVSQFGRIDDPSGVNYYGYSNVTANANDDVVVSYSAFSASTFPSSAYSYRTASDPLNTTESPYIYKAGQASYYKTFGGPTNRWGDYNGVTVDPVDNSFWALTEYARTPANTWGDYWANVTASNTSSCGVPSNLGTSNITTTSATLTWSLAQNAVSYNLQYRAVGSPTWLTASTPSTSINISGLTSNTQYEFQVQSDCGGGTTSPFSSIANFTTTAQTCSDIYEPNDTKGKAKAISVNTDIFGNIGFSGDIDWFSFSNTASSPNIYITLTNQTQDYDLQLYSPSGTKLKTSKNCCNLDESITYNTSTVGKYKVKVYPYSSFDASNCYQLHVSLSSTPFKLEVPSSVANSKAINVYPNPNKGNMTIEYFGSSESDVQLKIYDLMGKVVYNQINHAVNGTNTYSVNADKLSSGIYMVEINAGGEFERSKIMVQK